MEGLAFNRCDHEKRGDFESIKSSFPAMLLRAAFTHADPKSAKIICVSLRFWDLCKQKLLIKRC